MNIDEVKRLIESFYIGETTVEEEQALLHYFNKDGVSSKLLDEKEIFLRMHETDEVDIPPNLESKLENLIDELARNEKRKPNQNKRRFLIWIASAAASVAILISLGLYFNNKSDNWVTEEIQLKDTYNNPDEAYEEAQKALILLSSNFNKGVGQLTIVSTNIDKTNELLNRTLNHKKEKGS